MLGRARRERIASHAGRWLLLLMMPAFFAAWAGLRIYLETAGWSSVSTEIGDYRKQPLSDGSILELNTASAVRYRFGEQLREVYLTAGEVKFRVAHDAARPFVVMAGDTVVRAVGTAFTVRLLGSGAVEVLVSEGTIAVSHPTRENVLLELLHGRTVPIEGGAAVPHNHRVMDTGGRLAVIEVSRASIVAHDSWRKGILLFDGMPLREMAAELNRYNRKRIEIDPSIADVLMGGGYRANDIEGFLRRLDTVIPVRVTEARDGGTTVLRISPDHIRDTLQR